MTLHQFLLDCLNELISNFRLFSEITATFYNFDFELKYIYIYFFLGLIGISL